MNEQLKTNIRQLLNNNSALLNRVMIVFNNFATLKEIVMQLELGVEITILNNLLEESENFTEGFKNRCITRINDIKKTIPLQIFPNTITNKLYWDIAIHLFSPKTLGSMLNILMPHLNMFLYVDIHTNINFPSHLTSEERKIYIKKLQPVLNQSSLNALQQKPVLEELLHYIILDNKIFDVRSIEKLSLYLHAQLYNLLQKEQPALAAKLYIHSTQLMTLANDILILKNKGTSPKDVIQQLIQALILGGERMTGEKYASESAVEAMKHFAAYFYALPQETQEVLRALKIYTNKTLGELIDNEIARGECVETIANALTSLLERNSKNPILNTSPQLTSVELKKLEKKYPPHKNQESVVLNTQKEEYLLKELPEDLTSAVIQDMNLATTEDLISLLLNFSANFYETIFAHLDFSNVVNVLKNIALAIKNGFFNHEQQEKLVEAIGKHFLKLRNLQEKHFLLWAFNTENPFIVKAALLFYPEEERFNQLVMANACDYILHTKVVKQPAVFKILLECLAHDKQYEIFMLIDKDGKTLFDRICHPEILGMYVEQPEAFKMLFDLLYPGQRFLLAISLMNKYGYMLWEKAIKETATFKIIFELLSAKQRFQALSLMNKYDYTLWEKAIKETATFKIIFELLSAEQRFQALSLMNEYGYTLWEMAIKETATFKIIFELLSPEQRFQVLTIANKDGDSILSLAIKYKTELLCIVLEILPEEERLSALKTKYKVKEKDIIEDVSLIELIANDKIKISFAKEEFNNSFIPKIIDIYRCLKAQANKIDEVNIEYNILNETHFNYNYAEKLIEAIHFFDSLDAIKDYLNKNVNKTIYPALAGALQENGILNNNKNKLMVKEDVCAFWIKQAKSGIRHYLRRKRFGLHSHLNLFAQLFDRHRGKYRAKIYLATLSDPKLTFEQQLLVLQALLGAKDGSTLQNDVAAAILNSTGEITNSRRLNVKLALEKVHSAIHIFYLNTKNATEIRNKYHATIKNITEYANHATVADVKNGLPSSLWNEIGSKAVSQQQVAC